MCLSISNDNNHVALKTSHVLCTRLNAAHRVIAKSAITALWNGYSCPPWQVYLSWFQSVFVSQRTCGGQRTAWLSQFSPPCDTWAPNSDCRVLAVRRTFMSWAILLVPIFRFKGQKTEAQKDYLYLHSRARESDRAKIKTLEEWLQISCSSSCPGRLGSH